MTPTLVAIDDARFWSLAKGHPVHHHVSVVKALRDAGASMPLTWGDEGETLW